MKTEVMLSIIAVVVVLAVIAYFAYNKDGFTPTDTFMTPLQIATQKGYSQIVTFLNKQHANITAYPNWSDRAFEKTAQETVYLINYATSEIEALDAIKTMYWPGVGASAKIPVLVQNYHPYGGFFTPALKTVAHPRHSGEPDYADLRPIVTAAEFVHYTNPNFNLSYPAYLASLRLQRAYLRGNPHDYAVLQTLSESEFAAYTSRDKSSSDLSYNEYSMSLDLQLFLIRYRRLVGYLPR